MFSRSLNTVIRRIKYSAFIKYRTCGTIPSEAETDRDPAPLFFNQEVQQLLKTLTRVDYNKVFRTIKLGQRIDAPEYRFVTNAELDALMAESKKKAEERLQMPPVVKKRTEINEIISRDPALQGYKPFKFVFTDISFNVSNLDRTIVVRELDGTLRRATWDERHRLNEIYYPSVGRKISKPKKFEQEYFTDLLNREEYEFILNCACVQFEPNDPEYHRITEEVYSQVNLLKHFDRLRSTRHYGPFAFYLAWNKNIDTLIMENIQTSRIDDAALLVRLYHKIHPTAKSADVQYDGDDLKLVENYIQLESPKKGTLELQMQSYKEIERERKELAEGIKRAHGYQ